jgi:glycerol 3-phosphatase-2
VTNNSALTVADYLAKLERCGIPAAAAELVTSAQVAAGLIAPDADVLVCAGPGVEEALAARPAKTLRWRGANPPAVEAVIVGWHRDFDYDELTAAMLAVRAGARLIGTNDDATYPTPDGAIPGGGSILAAVAYASGVTPIVAGKPNEPAAAYVQERVGDIAVVVGDRPSTDGLFARRLDANFSLVLSGVTKAGDLPVDPAPDRVTKDLAELVP